MDQIDSLVAKYGEGYRHLITDAINYYLERKHLWKVDLNIEEYIEEIVSHAAPPN